MDDDLISAVCELILIPTARASLCLALLRRLA
jgi:hypothetical protein